MTAYGYYRVAGSGHAWRVYKLASQTCLDSFYVYVSDSENSPAITSYFTNSGTTDPTNDSMIMGEARDIVLNDLNSGALGFGVLFDEGKFNTLQGPQQDKLIQDLISLESSYYDRDSVNFNPNIMTFLSLYGLGQEGVEPGMALEAFLSELRNRGM